MCRKSGIFKTIKYVTVSFAVTACLFAGSVFGSVNSYAASSGRRHHEDTWDYCMQVSDVTVTMSEIQSMSNGQREALVAGTSGYSLIYRNENGSLTGRTADDYWTDFSGVSWSEGTYTVTVRIAPNRMDHDSSISYTLTVIDDLPDEPDPPAEPDPPVDPGEEPGEGGSGQDSGEDKTG